MAWADNLKGTMIKWLGITPSQDIVSITIKEDSTHEVASLKNKIWYRGNPSELEQFFNKFAQSSVVSQSVAKTRFWASSTEENSLIRKMHTGIPSLMVDKLADIVVNDIMAPTSSKDESSKLMLWKEIQEDLDFSEILNQAIVDTLALGDGAFKVSVDTNLSEFPLVEFYAGSNVDYSYQRGKLKEVTFYTKYKKDSKTYILNEFYGRGYVDYKLLDEYGKEIPLERLEETSDLQRVEFDGDYIMAVPLRFYRSSKWSNRGESIFERKSEIFDALDEIASTWLDAVRAGRVKQYIPENLVPRDENGKLKTPTVFNNYILTGGLILGEGESHKIETIQGNVEYLGYLQSYLTFLDSALQGIISPSTLGIDVKKLDNAESQREKEKTTLYTRDKIVGSLQKALPKLVDVVLKTYHTMTNQEISDTHIEFVFGQYANPSFESLLDAMGKAKQTQIISTEKLVEELYGDSLSKEEKAEEVLRIKKEYGTNISMDEPFVDDNLLKF